MRFRAVNKVCQVGHPLQGAFIFEKTKNEAKSLFANTPPCGCLWHFELDAPLGRANRHPCLAALSAPSMARRPASTQSITKLSNTRVEHNALSCFLLTCRSVDPWAHLCRSSRNSLRKLAANPYRLLTDGFRPIADIRLLAPPP